MTARQATALQIALWTGLSAGLFVLAGVCAATGNWFAATFDLLAGAFDGYLAFGCVRRFTELPPGK